MNKWIYAFLCLGKNASQPSVALAKNGKQIEKRKKYGNSWINKLKNKI